MLQDKLLYGMSRKILYLIAIKHGIHFYSIHKMFTPSFYRTKIKEQIKKTKHENNAKKSAVLAKHKISNKNSPIGYAVPKSPKLGGGEGKR